MRYFLTGILLALSTSTAFAQSNIKHTVSGYVREEGSGELLPGVNVYLPELRSGTITNTYGFYSVTIPATDTLKIVFSYVGFHAQTMLVTLLQDVELNINLKSDILLGEVTISAERSERQSESVKMSVVSLPVAQVKNVPSLLGEKDVLKVLQLMPGVQKGSEGSSGLYVRGGGPDQNLIILDDAIVYNASHLFGFFSLFNGDALKSIELTKGGFPARYGGRLSSVLEMNMKEGDKEKWKGEGGIGLISSRLTVEGPLKKDKSSILISGRRTYADLIVAPILKAANQENTGYYFYDLNAKVNWDFGRKNKLYLSGYFGQDKFYMKYNSSRVKEDVGFLWGNATATVRWNHLYNSRLFSNTSAVFSSYRFGIYDRYRVIDENKNYYAEYYSGIRDLTLKHDFDFIPSTSHWIKAGAIIIYHRFNPHAFIEEDIPNQVHTRDVDYTTGTESGIYIEDTWQPADRLKINGGIRLSMLNAGKVTYINPEPRLSIALRTSPDFAVKLSYASMNQYIHMLTNTGLSLPTDLWVPATDRVKPQKSKQVAAGIVKDLTTKNISFSLEGYYKQMNNVLAYREGATFMELNEPGNTVDENWEDKVTAGVSESYGAEFMVQKKEGRITGWVGYTLSWTTMQFDSLNFGRKFYARYDRRHDISVVAVYKASERITLSGTWVFGTGNAITIPLSEYWSEPHSFQENGYIFYQDDSNPMFFYRSTVLENGEKNNMRMRPYHRLDIGIQFHKQKKWGERTWEFSVYNAYSRLNPFFYYNETQYINNKRYGILKQVSLFPIIPSFTYSFRFQNTK